MALRISSTFPMMQHCIRRLPSRLRHGLRQLHEGDPYWEAFRQRRAMSWRSTAISAFRYFKGDSRTQRISGRRGLETSLTATWDSATRVLRVFTDGVLGETKTTAGPLIVGTLALTFGKSGTAFPLGPITVDEVRLSDIVRYTGNFTPQHSYVMDSHTIGYWSFGTQPPPPQECSAADASSNHHDGTFVGNPLPECVEGISGNAVRFDEIQNFVSI